MLRNPDLRPEASAIGEAASTAATENLYRHTTAYVYLDRIDQEWIGSGTLVQVDSRLLLATVAHTVPSNLAAMWLVKKWGLVTPERLACVQRRAVSDNADVAVFELDPGVIARLGAEPIGLERVHDAGAGMAFPARVVGFPKAWVTARKPYHDWKQFRCLSYGCEPIEPSRWPAISTVKGTFDEATDIVFEYSRDAIEYESKLPVPAGVPDPYGISGGGLWQRKRRVDDHELWTADGYCLFGIQSTWLNEKGFLKAVQIIHWLKVVADEYPELRDELYERFPRLGKLPS